MSLIMEDAMECESRGYRDCDLMVCHECIGNKALKAYTKNNGAKCVCDYCGKTRKAITIEDLMPAIMDGIHYQYDKAVDCLPVEHGEYQGETFDTCQLIKEELYDEIDAADERILDDIVGTMYDDCWCLSDPYTVTEEDRTFYDWTSFCKMVKEKVRFVFYKTEETKRHKSNPAAILDTIASYANTLRLERQIDQNCTLYRSRTHETDKWCCKLESFAPPPKEKASAGRMNAAGINVLYLALDPYTALCETNVNGNDYASVALFRLKKTIRVLDLTKIRKIPLPSIFDSDNWNKRSSLLFLKRFAENISAQSKIKDIDYVPTQIVTEYFRYVKHAKTGGYEGILYDSTQNPGGQCVALFMTRDEVLSGKYGIHIYPKDTMYYKKEYTKVEDDKTKNARDQLSE